MHLGLEPYIPYLEYSALAVSFLLTLFWRPIVGIFVLLPMIPLQTFRYRLNDLPLGSSVMGVMLLAVFIGLLLKGKPILPKTPWTKLLCVYGIFTFGSLCLGSIYLGRPFPWPGDPRFEVWQGYMIMPALLLLVAAVEPSRRQIKAIVIVMCLSTLALDYSFWNNMSGRDYSSYTNDLRGVESSIGYAGTNGLAAFGAQVTALLLALAAFERKMWMKSSYYGLALFSVVCTVYSLSRGGYAALLVGVLFLAVVKQRKLLVILLLFLFTWTAVLPQAAQERVLMSYDTQSGSLDHSAETRLTLWQDTLEVISTSPILGTGFNTYAYMHRQKRADGGEGYYEDTHNIYLKVLAESGAAGLLIFGWFVVTTFLTGFRLFRTGNEPLFRALGLGLAAWLICSLTANCFGDRWSYLQVNGYMWVLGGLVAQAFRLQNDQVVKPADAPLIDDHAQELSESTPIAAQAGEGNYVY